jgi:5-methyltetrahydrofolate--homocysteine methyltransferase
VEPLLDRLSGGEIVVGDGAIGTQLLEQGLEAGQCPEVLNLEHPEILSEFAGRYLEAGAEILTTNTFGGSPLKLRLNSLEDRTEEINWNAVKAVRGVAGDRAYVSGSIGPTGAVLKPYGDAAEDEVYGAFERQVRVLVDAGVDLFCVETMFDLREATLAVRAAKALSPNTPVMASMTFDATPKGYYTIMGTNIEESAAGLVEAGADVVGTNCGFGIEKMIEIARELVHHASVPVIVQSNAGLPEVRGGEVMYAESPEFMADRIANLIELPVSVIGGCCGTSPEHIRAIRERLDRGR